MKVLTLLSLLVQKYIAEGGCHWKRALEGAHFTCVTSTKVQILTQDHSTAIKTGDLERLGLAGRDPLLTAEEVKSDKKARAELVERVRAGAPFPCFTSAKVQIPTQNLAETALVCGALMMEGIADMCGVTNWRLLGEGGEDPGF